MTLAEILKRSACARPNWDALLRRGQIAFMKRGREAGEQYGYEHYTAFRTFGLLRELGLEASVAGEAVNASMGSIMAAVEGASRNVEVGVRLVRDVASNALAFDYIGWPSPDYANADEVGRTSVTLNGVMLLLKAEQEG
jgi:hypothetical protein